MTKNESIACADTLNGVDYRKDADAFGSKLRSLRERRGLSLDELATLTGIEKSALSKFENSVRLPRYETLLRILDEAEVPPQDLLPERFSTYGDNWERISVLYRKLPESDRKLAERAFLAMLYGLRSKMIGTE